MSTEDTQGKPGDEKPAQPEIETWDDYYDSPDAKIILVSSDKVGFRVDAHYLKRKSGFIKDMLEIPSAQPLELSPIILDHSSKVVRLFIECVLARSPLLVQAVSENLQGFFEMCDRFQAEEVGEAIKSAIQAAVRQRPLPQGLDPWAVFKLAASRDDVDLARAAIVNFDTSMPFCDFLRKPASFFDDIPVRYASAVLLAACQAFQVWMQEEDLDRCGWMYVSQKLAVK